MYTQFLTAQTGIVMCIDNLLSLMNSNLRLKLNIDKTEIKPIGSKSHISLVDSVGNMEGNKILFKPLGKYLGVLLDQILSMQLHISSMCWATSLELWKIALSILTCLITQLTG